MEADAYIRYLLALLFVVGLIMAIGYAARRFGMGLNVAPRFKGQSKRLSIVEMAPLDAKRRLVLIKRDQTEHLILLGVTSETVIETGICPALAETKP
ncbi:Flagellar assembly protein FliO, putative (fragment) [Rhodospirillaceae bacterium LM-1]